MPSKPTTLRSAVPHRPLGWWYWFATVLFLVAALPLGREIMLYAAIVLSIVQSIHFARRTGGPSAFPAQVRLAYLGLLVLGLAPYMAIIHWLLLIGTTSLLLVGYCPLARILALMPWNRSVPLTARLVARVIFTPPLAGPATRLTAMP